MDLGLRDKTALVTGGTAGIGLAAAASLAREGARVFITGREEDKLATAVASLRPSGDVTGILANAATQEGAATIMSALPGVDILVNNLGTYEIRPYQEIDDERWRMFFDTNVLTGIRLSRHYLPLMVARNWGRVVFVSSATGVATPGPMVHYGMTKTAELAVSRGLAQQTKGTGVTVNAVLPGTIRTAGMLRDMHTFTGSGPDVGDAEVEKRFFATIAASFLLQRLIEPEEVGDLVAYLASPLAAAINGTALRIDGGATPTIV
jgi:NAD(P)-dependent dehydrogenase (short-subunit alcohol dehydrogenase family)